MAFKIEETFEIQAPIAEVWAFLIDPRRVVVCLPGAELTDVVDERTYAGRVRVKVGPVTAAYKGTARLKEVNETERLMRLTGEGKETGGAGSAKMVMTGRLSTGASGATQVRVEAEIDIAGKMAQFGRGLIEDVSKQLFRQFGTNMQETLAQRATDNGASNATEPAGADEVPDIAHPASTNGKPSASSPTQPVGVFSLVFRAIWSRVKHLFGSGRTV